MKQTIIRVFVVMVAMTWCVNNVRAQQATPKYNVLFFLIDDLRAELGSYGGMAKTPNIDKLAGQGVKFERAYCQYALCNPSRSSMLTGRHPITTGVLGNGNNLQTMHPDWVSIPRMFKDNGYASLRTGKVFHGVVQMDDPKGWTEGGTHPSYGPNAQPGEPEAALVRPIYALQNAPASQPVDRNSREYLIKGIEPTPGQNANQARNDHWIAFDDGPNGGVGGSTRQAIDYMNRYKDKQFFIACGYSKPHSPLDTSLRFFQEYDINKIPLPVDYSPRITVPAGFPQGSIRPNNADLFIGRRESTPETARDMIRAYLACTTSTDFNVGLVLAELDRLGLREKTIVVFWGDHGFQLGEKGKWSKAGSVWEQGARVPLIMHVPGMAGNGKSSPRTVESVDIYRTLAELCGLPVQEGVEGRSLVPLLKNPQAEWNHPAYTVWAEDGRTLTAIAVRNEKYRYAEFTAGAGGAMLLDQEKDPHEINNVVNDPQYASAKAELSKLVAEYRARFKPAGQ